MRKVWIVRSRAAEIELERLRALLAEAGCATTEDLEVSAAALEALEIEPDEACLVLPLTPDLEAEEDLENMLIAAERRGCSVVAVWPEGADGTAAPIPVRKHADQVIPWDPERLRECLEDAPPRFETPKGEPRLRPETPTNKC